MNIQGKLDNPAVKIYQITYIFGLALGSGLFMAVNWIWPAAGVGISEPFDAMMIEGVAPSEDTYQRQGELPAKDSVVLTVQDVKK